MLDEASLLVRIAQQDRNALSILYDRYARIVYAIAWKSLNSVEDCEEVVLDVFAQVWRIAERYDPTRGTVDKWLFTLARSRILDRLRKLQRLHKVADAVDAVGEIEFPTRSVDPLEEVAIRERREQVMTALSQIPPEQREVIELSYYQGLSHTEIAERTGLSLGTVKTRLRLGLSKLKTAINSSC
jgi:RNA polymerase sigma-70 factor (ECF subfamily)